MKKLLVLLFCSTALFAMPAKHTPTLVSQPDGTRFTVIGFGDERYNFAETLEGYVVLQALDKFWYFAGLDAGGRFVPTSVKVRGPRPDPTDPSASSIQKHYRESRVVVAGRLQTHPIVVRNIESLVQTGGTRIAGTSATQKNVLVLCVEFSDIPSTQTALSFQQMINDDTWRGGVGGLSKYYEDVSYNMLSVEANYVDWITATNPSSYYAYSNANYSTHMQELVDQCVDAAEASGVNFSLYDNDGDGVVDGLFLVHSGIGAEEGSQTQYIWSHSGSLGSTYTNTYDGVVINSYIMMPELYDGGHVEIGVFCHEYGHMLGLPDLYDVDYATHGRSSGVGNFCLMAGGSWGGDGSSPERPAFMSAYCRALIGFVTPEVVTTDQALSIPQVETDPTIYKVWLDDNQADEYVLIENRQMTGFDLNLPGSGLLMYHVDRTLSDIWPASNNINITNTHIGVKVYEADGLEEMASGTSGGDDGDPYPGSTANSSLTVSSTPNTSLWNGNPSSVEITGISSSASTMTANVVVPTYYGSSVQFYRQNTGYVYGNPATNTSYAMIRCVPTESGKIVGARVYSRANRYTTVNADVYSTFSGGYLLDHLGSTASGTSAAIDEFMKLDFPAGIDVTAGVPVYVRFYFQRSSGGNVIPIDITPPATGNTYFSTAGTTYTNLPSYDLLARVIYRNNNPLPVQVTQFGVRMGSQGVQLYWETASELNNFGFQVEKDTVRATNAFTAVRGGFVPGHGTTLEPQSYGVVDSGAVVGTWMYRLKQIDMDGTVHYTEPIQVTVNTTGVSGETILPTEYALEQNFPNPFNPTTTIRYNVGVVSRQQLVAPMVRLAVYDLLGREVAVLVNERKEPGSYEVQFDASGLSTGVYLYRIDAGDFKVVKKLLLVK